MQFNGKLVTTLLVAVALAAASFAWWFQYSRGQRALEYWTGEQAAVIRHGQSAELLVLDRPAEDAGGEASETLAIDGEPYRVAQRAVLSGVPGFVHARHALIDDGSYRWEQTPPEEIIWSHALDFANEAGRRVMVVISLEGGYLRPVEGERPLAMSEKLQRGLADFFAEQLARQDAATDAEPLLAP